MTFLELCQAARQECGVQGQGPSAVTSQSGILKKIVDWVQKSDLFIQSKHGDWDFLWAEFSANTVPNSADIAKPSDLGLWDRESFAVNRGLEGGYNLVIGNHKADRLNPGYRESTQPGTILILPDNNLRLSAPANAIYSIDANYWKTPTLLTTDTQTPAYPSRFHWAVIEKTKMYFFADQEAFDLYKEASLQFEDWMDKLEGNQLPGQQQRTQAQPDPDYFTVRPG